MSICVYVYVRRSWGQRRVDRDDPTPLLQCYLLMPSGTATTSMEQNLVHLSFLGSMSTRRKCCNITVHSCRIGDLSRTNHETEPSAPLTRIHTTYKHTHTYIHTDRHTHTGRLWGEGRADHPLPSRSVPGCDRI